MPWYVFAISAAVALAGIVMILRGRRGRLIDDHPHCVHCGYDLFGQPPDSHICPECGTKLVSDRNIRIGTRQRYEGLIYGGLAVALFGAIPLATLITMSVRDIDLIRLKPTPWVLHDAIRENYPAPNRRELLYRAQHDSLSPAGIKSVVATALSLQANRATPWQPIWGSLIELLQSKGQVSAADWQTYQSQAEIATLNIRPIVARGDPIPYQLHIELRGSNSLGPGARVTNLQEPLVSVPGSAHDPLLSPITWGSFLGGYPTPGVDAEGRIALLPAVSDSLPLGPHPLAITVFSPGTLYMVNPSVFGNLTVQGTWTLVPADQRSVTLYKDPSLAAKVDKSLSYKIVRVQQVSGGFEIWFPNKILPVDCAFDVFLKCQNVERQGSGFVLRGSSSGGIESHGWAFVNYCPDFIGQRGDIILRPSPAQAATTVDITRLLDHEVVFKDVMFDAPKSAATVPAQ